MITIRPVGHGEQRAAADAIARELYGQFGAHHVARRESGAPFLVTLDEQPLALELSISHTNSYIALVVSDKRCGVDIESVDRPVEHLAPRFASAQEIELCRAIFVTNPALMVWCAKEALYKVLGREGVDFRRDLCIVASDEGGRLRATAFGQTIELEWFVATAENLLVVRTLYTEKNDTDKSTPTLG